MEERARYEEKRNPACSDSTFDLTLAYVFFFRARDPKDLRRDRRAREEDLKRVEKAREEDLKRVEKAREERERRARETTTNTDGTTTTTRRSVIRRVVSI